MTQKEFKIVDCWTNKIYIISALDYNDALIQIYKKLNHLSVVFV